MIVDVNVKEFIYFELTLIFEIIFIFLIEC